MATNFVHLTSSTSWSNWTCKPRTRALLGFIRDNIGYGKGSDKDKDKVGEKIYNEIIEEAAKQANALNLSQASRKVTILMSGLMV